MGKYTSGLGMTDVVAMMRAIEALHSAVVVFHMRTRTRQLGGSMIIECVATFDALPGSDLPKEVKVESEWPSEAARTFDGLCYNLLWQLDYAIQQKYEQMTLKEK